MDKAPHSAGRNLRAAVLFGACVSAAVLSAGPASAQGFFDFLFGGRQSYDRQSYYDQGSYYERRPVVAYAPDPGQDYRAPPRRLKRAKHNSLDDLVFTDKPVKTPPPPVGEGPLGAFLNDPTLRAGDVVVTSKGLMVYRGPEGDSHRNKDFIGLAKAHSIGKSERRFLASVEKANRLAPHFEIVATADADTADKAGVEQASIDTPARRHR